MTPLEIQTKMRTLSEFILESERSVRSGTLVDMSGIDSDVTLICNQAISLPPAQALEIQPLMAELIGNLERFATALRDYKAARR